MDAGMEVISGMPFLDSLFDGGDTTFLDFEPPEMASPVPLLKDDLLSSPETTLHDFCSSPVPEQPTLGFTPFLTDDNVPNLPSSEASPEPHGSRGTSRGTSEESEPRSNSNEPRKKKRKPRDPIPVTAEEIEELAEMGMPEHLLQMARRPMTTEELRYFKKERRLFKNKVSAHVSRQKHKEFVDSLEAQIESMSSENKLLKRKLEDAEERESNLERELSRMKAMLANVVPSMEFPSMESISSLMPPFKKKKWDHSNNSQATGAVMLIFLFSFGLFFNTLRPSAPSVFSASGGPDPVDSRSVGRVLLSMEEEGLAEQEEEALLDSWLLSRRNRVLKESATDIKLGKAQPRVYTRFLKPVSPIAAAVPSVAVQTESVVPVMVVDSEESVTVPVGSNATDMSYSNHEGMVCA